MQFLMIDAQLRKLLIAAIRFYRRRLAGRGLLRAVRCTFEQCESCSAYGERMIREAPSALVALARIRRRLRRCRQLSLYRLPDGGLGWGDAYDGLLDDRALALQRIDSMLAEDGEGAAVRDAVHRAGAEVLVHAGRARGLPVDHTSTHLLARDAAAVERALTRRIRRRLTWAGILVVCGTLCWAGGLAALPAMLFGFGGVVAAAFTWPSMMLRGRLHRMTILHAIDEPHCASASIKAAPGVQ